MAFEYDTDLSFIWRAPTKVVFGANAATQEIESELESLGVEKALIVTDSFLGQHEIVEKIKKAMGGRLAGVYDKVEPDSGLHMIDEGAELGREVGATGVVSVGGGSSIDTAKGIAILLHKGGNIKDYDGYNVLDSKVSPHIVVPTTAGTGSEVTYAAVVKDHENNQKLIIADWNLIPDVALLDPTLTVGLPPVITAHTGIDALTHAIEGMHSLEREPVADAVALHAIRLVDRYLKRCMEKPDDLVARGQMLIASYLAGAAFGNAQVGLVHAMAHTVGARHKVPHGLANSIALPHVIRHNTEACADVYADMANALNLLKEGMSDEDASEALAQYCYGLAGECSIERRYRDVGVPEDALAELSELTLSDAALFNNPRPTFEPEEVLEVFRKAW
ncbi:MAG: iron-containing alcohol dehydrogenase [Planctomycetes bacterium]|nr:iron-containing alcohol dehydrogenase [Planctomycetota bacterium]